ncbi:MAG TPA: DUF1980 domain-containing protein, partial [Symbiobacteriaceae bacterium]|nr:DUF1980 domain-containing protein [Symbiobacteriaceae bacterium]
MEWRESRDYNPLVRAILLLGLAAFLVKLIVTGEIRLYIHPRFTWFTATAAVGMSLMALGQLIRAVSGATYGPPLRV